jgi:hypothetical protein
MRISHLRFSTLRQLLIDLGFREQTNSASCIFEHEPTDTVLIFRAYQPREHVNWPDLVSVRRQLDERGLLAAESFDHRLRKASA